MGVIERFSFFLRLNHSSLLVGILSKHENKFMGFLKNICEQLEIIFGMQICMCIFWICLQKYLDWGKIFGLRKNIWFEKKIFGLRKNICVEKKYLGWENIFGLRKNILVEKKYLGWEKIFGFRCGETFGRQVSPLWWVVATGRESKGFHLFLKYWQCCDTMWYNINIAPTNFKPLVPGQNRTLLAGGSQIYLQKLDLTRSEGFHQPSY